MKVYYFIAAFVTCLVLGEAATSAQQPKVSKCPCQCMNGLNGYNGRDGKDGNDGKDGIKGEKGETGPPGAYPQGAIKIGDTSAACASQTAGSLRYNASKKVLELCNGLAWKPLIATDKGHIKSNPGRHCLDILNSGVSRGNGLYWIDPNGGSTDDAFQAFCDMTTEGGGWTLVATKVSYNFLFVKSSFSAQAAQLTNSNAASRIHPAMGDWTEVMFRFGDSSDVRLIYNRQGGAPSKEKEQFDNFLMGTTGNDIKDVNGFYKYTPADGGKRNPAVGFATIRSLHFYSNSMISEDHTGSDKWLDMWNGAESRNNYVYSDNNQALGTKCVAGYCYLNKPIWFMVR